MNSTDVSLSWRKVFTADKLTLTLLTVRWKMVMIWLIKSTSVIFSHLQNDLQIFSFVPSITTDRKWEPLPFVCRWFYVTLYGISIAFCELKNQRWSSLYVHILPIEWKGPEGAVSVWRHLKYPRAVAFSGPGLWLNLCIPCSHPRVCLEVELLITSLDAVQLWNTVHPMNELWRMLGTGIIDILK